MVHILTAQHLISNTVFALSLSLVGARAGLAEDQRFPHLMEFSGNILSLA